MACWIYGLLLVICLPVAILAYVSGPRMLKQPQNATVLVKRKHTLSCKAAGEANLRITWDHFDKKLPVRGTNYRILLKKGKLKFTQLLIRHRGYYRCNAEDNQGVTHSDYVYLDVQAPAVIVQGPTDRAVNWGTFIHLDCRSMGLPEPHITWRYNGKPYVDPETEMIYSKDKLKVNVTESGNYSCSAENRHVEGFTVDTWTSRVTVKGDSRPKGYCAPYNGTVCKSYLKSRSIYYNGSMEKPWQRHENIVIRLLEEIIADAGSFCRRPAERLLCHYAFPDCDMSSNIPLPKPLCKENCLAVKNMFCFNEWITTVNNKLQGIFYKSREHFRLPNCDSLPSLENDSDHCSEADLFQIEDDKITSTCYQEDGRYYKGKANVTESGLECQAWAEQTPQEHTRHPNVFFILKDSYNYCRNPGGKEERPWCYTKNPFTRWEYCRVPRCDEAVTKEREEFFTTETIVIIATVSAICLGLVFFIIFLCYRICPKKRNNYEPTPQYDLDIDIDKLPSNDCYHLGPPISDLNPKLEKLQYPRNDIVYTRDIGQGAFGRVFQAKAPGITGDLTLVAVKMLKEDASEEIQKDFDREASLMVEFEHPNIVKLLGVCAIGRPMCLLFEYMGRGDLNEFLRNCSPDHFIVRQRSVEWLTEERAKLNHIEQLEICEQIASGMVYISKRGYVHRDLATRNCLVGDYLTVKISDFGLTRSLDNNDYYEGSDDEAIPIRWMPIESILYNKFSAQSDVWSFGVVLWEVFAFALQPYYGMSHEEVVKYIGDGKTLSCPDNTPQQVYDLMKQCWSWNPQQRPSFQTIHTHISTLQDSFVKRRKKSEKV